MNSFFQCCYTNKTVCNGDTFSSGWETVSVSPDIPDKVLETCKKIHIINSSITSDMVDEYGKTLKLEEGYGDGDYFYITKTQYGLTDRAGRPNMFAHTFVLPLHTSEYDFNDFLSIEDSNFKDNEEAADHIPVQLARRSPFTLSEAMSICGLDLSRYITLIECIYARCSEKVSLSPLYIEYDGTEKNMRSLLHCIYSGVHLFLRRNLSYASCATPNTNNRDIIFTVNAKNKDCFVIPKTGENNIVSSRLEKKFVRYGFVECGVKSIAADDKSDYFTRLEETAVKLGDKTGGNTLVLKIAHKLMNNIDLKKLGDDELVNQLGDALRTDITENLYMNSYISDLFSECSERKLKFTDEMERALAGRSIQRNTGQSESGICWDKLYDELDEVLASVRQIKSEADELYRSELESAAERQYDESYIEKFKDKYSELMNRIKSLSD